MRRAARFASILLAIALCSLSSRAALMDSYADLWYYPGESGWGVNIAQQSDTIFATLFIYGSDRKPAWYVGSAVTYTGIQDSRVVFSGALYATTGPWFGAGSFDSRSVTTRQVGTIKLSFDDPGGGYIDYTIDGTSVSKRILRQSWKAIDISGKYTGVLAGTYSGTGCGTHAGYQEERATFTISQSGTKVTIVANEASRTCTYTGDYLQFGHTAQIYSGSETGSCTDGMRGPFDFWQFEMRRNGFTSDGTRSFLNCTWGGRLGGLPALN